MTDPADRRPGLPAADLHERIREAAFALLLTERKPIAAAEIASTTDVSAGTLPAMLDQLARAGWIDRDEEGRVTGSAGLSLTTGPHRIAIDGTEFRTWCAYDSIGIAAALRADAAIRAQCAVCGAEIALDTRAGRPPASRSERLWLASGGAICAVTGRWRNYLFGESNYVLLSLIAKSALAWQVFANTLIPR